MLDHADGPFAAKLVAGNVALRAEAAQLLPELKAASEPASRVEILEILVRKAPHYGITSKMAGEWGVFFADYLDALEGLSPYAIEDGFLRWNRGEGHKDIRMAGFYPRSGQLYLLAQAASHELGKALYRCKLAVGEAKRIEEREHSKPTVEERKKIAEDFRRLAASLGTSGPKSAAEVRPSVSPQQMAAQLRQSVDEVGDVV